jgi:hypothetical protein
LVHCQTPEFRPIIELDLPRHATSILEFFKGSDDTVATDRTSHFDPQRFLRHLVDQGQTAKGTPVDKSVVGEVPGPTIVRPLNRSDDSRPRDIATALLPTPPNLKPLLTIDPLDALVIVVKPLSPKHQGQHRTPPTSPFHGQLPKPIAQLAVVARSSSVAKRRPVQSGQRTRPTLR